jgi:hypothetical protein
MKTFKIIAFSTLLFALPKAQAHPVFYADGWGLMMWNSPEKTEFYGAYTLSHRFAVGGRYFGFRDLETLSTYPTENYYLAQTAFLLKRWNAPASQGNIYLQLGGGAAGFENASGLSQNRPAYMAELEADWEDRRIYTLAKLSYLKASEREERSGLMLRAGFAPYLADFEELNTWIILQAEQSFQNSSTVALTPLIRLFYRNFMTELGYGLDGGFRFNFMTHL